mmetsp:Transcript_82166/g.129402  ORF Transcript_82166/g.129402 Transcript_82166/m.129402 type:complete len:643 (+) Transcript_82166:44-1972(+)|eukprot:CAMPEP_0169092454 /NCGR_PEP_ID=MMETSP1015-20121227/16912_1 /TAXON_ID=342587 /ORGANISM="Karlodinium micrum, Strain CCMP2283" /LENGTH=642 /DNA_ID=CAMNT_0009153029 /DNA_START=42 /DNA_END=1970 /DNA_ORIENTATION=+
MHKFLKIGKDFGPPPAKRPRVGDAELPTVPQQHAFLDLAKKRDWVGIKASLSTSPELINVQPLGRWTALHQAASAGHSDAVTYLLECSADVTLKTNDGKTPLDVATTDIVKSLLKTAESQPLACTEVGSSMGKGSDVAKVDADGKSSSVVMSSEKALDVKKTPEASVWQVQPTELPTVWVDMGVERQILLNDAKAGGILKAMFRDGGRTYVLDLESFTQTDFTTGEARPIRLSLPSGLPDAKASVESETQSHKIDQDVKELTIVTAVSTSDDEKLEPGQTTEVAGSGAKPYIVKNCGGGVWSCTCVNWKMQGKLPTNQRSCKHILGVRGAEAEQQRLASGGSPSPTAAPFLKTLKATAVSSEKAQGGTVSPPALLLANKWEEHVDPTGWWISEKLDGMRAYWDPDRQCLLSRLGNTVLCPKHLLASLPDVALDGELFLGRGRFQELMSVVKNSANVGKTDGPWKDVVYTIFDMPKHGGKFEERMEALRSKLGTQSSPSGHRFASFHEHIVCKSRAHLDDELKEVQAKGGEGLMIRRAGSLYEAGRSSSLLKVKTFQDEEAVVIGHELGKGRNSAVTGALRCRNKAKVEFSVGTGLNDAQRANPPKVGEIITYRFFELTKDNKPRFPSFVGVRADADRTGLEL